MALKATVYLILFTLSRVMQAVSLNREKKQHPLVTKSRIICLHHNFCCFPLWASFSSAAERLYSGLPAPWQCCMPAGDSLSETPRPTRISHGQRAPKKKWGFFCFLPQILLQWRSCTAIFTTLRQGWTALWAWTWTWKWRHHILHPTEGPWHWPRCIPRSRLPAESAPSTAQLACPPRTKWACLSNGLFLFFLHHAEYILLLSSAQVQLGPQQHQDFLHPVNPLLLKLPWQVFLSCENSYTCNPDARCYHNFGSPCHIASAHLHQTLPLTVCLCKPPFCDTFGCNPCCPETFSIACCQAGRGHIRFSCVQKHLWWIQ